MFFDMRYNGIGKEKLPELGTKKEIRYVEMSEVWL